MFNKVLIANRGEIAVRIIRACKELGVKSVAVYSDADKNSLHVRLADNAICIGPAKATDSYLSVTSLISAVEVVDAEAVHPGYGFLSENSEFAEVCENCGIKFIGPTSSIIKRMGDKIIAKGEAEKAKMPTLPWSGKNMADEEEALKIAKEIGFPVLIKAASGGGGRGMKLVHTAASFGNAFHTAKSEAKAVFNDPNVFIEKFCEEPRHIEIQIMADEHGNVIHLGERECSIQRRHQKILEECPSPFVSEELREKMGKASVDLIKSIGYSNVGTIEFLVDKHENFYFMEMNTRIQVEHPVTEMVTDIDLVKEQLRIASGEKLSITQEDVTMKGHSIECRINAEDPKTFVPSPGRINELIMPGGRGVRIDSGIYCNYTVPSYYDPMIAKIIVHGKDRNEAVRKMKMALNEFHIEGIKTNAPLLREILRDSDFKSGNTNIEFINRFL